MNRRVSITSLLGLMGLLLVSYNNCGRMDWHASGLFEDGMPVTLPATIDPGSGNALLPGTETLPSVDTLPTVGTLPDEEELPVADQGPGANASSPASASNPPSLPNEAQNPPKQHPLSDLDSNPGLGDEYRCPDKNEILICHVGKDASTMSTRCVSENAIKIHADHAITVTSNGETRTIGDYLGRCRSL